MSDLGDVLELLHGARSRYRSVRLTLREWSHYERSRQAFERRHEREEARGKRSIRLSVSSGGSRPRPETCEELTRLWIESDRARREIVRNGEETVVVRDGATWWMRSPHAGMTTNGGDPHHHAGTGEGAEPLLDPSSFVGQVDLEVGGRCEVAGREGIAARAVVKQNNPLTFAAWRMMNADELELVVDAERGILLRLASLIDGEPFHVTEVEEVAFDEVFSAETFRIELRPGESFAPPEGARLQFVSLQEAARQVAFELFVPTRVGTGWHLERVIHFEASDRPSMIESVNLQYGYAGGSRRFSIQETAEPHPWLGDAELATARRDGVVLKVLEPDADDAPMPRHVLVEKEGTNVDVSSQELPLEQLIEIALSLEPVPGEPPPPVER